MIVNEGMGTFIPGGIFGGAFDGGGPPCPGGPDGGPADCGPVGGVCTGPDAVDELSCDPSGVSDGVGALGGV